MNDRRCEIWERIRAWPSTTPRRRSPPPLDVPIRSGSRGAHHDTPGPRGNTPKDVPEHTLSEPMSRAIRQIDELHRALSSMEAVTQACRIRLHVLDGCIAALVEEETRHDHSR